MSLTFRDRFYWFRRNLLVFILNVLVSPIFYVMSFTEDIYNGIKVVMECNGSTQLHYPWEHKWPFFEEKR